MKGSIKGWVGWLLLASMALGWPAAADSRSARDDHWAATWAAASKARTAFDRPLPALSNVTLRQVVHVSAGGHWVRVWLTNEAGTKPLRVGASTVGLRASGGDVVPGSGRRLTFGGAGGVTIAPGARVVSDPVRLTVRDLGYLVISTYLPDDVTAAGSPATYHVRSLQTSYLLDGDQTTNASISGARTEASWFFLAGVDVFDGRRTPVVGALGDSITDGDQQAFPNEPVDLDARYTDFLARRLLATRGEGAFGRAAVVNLGISGNQVTASFIGENVQARLDRDALARTGITHLIVTEGINDIGLPGLLTAIGLPTPAVSAESIISGLQQVAARAHARGLTVIAGTLSPSGGSPLPGYSGPDVEARRQAVNAWIRSSQAFDAVADFDAALRDPANPAVMRADLTADGLHPNTEGYRRMAEVAYRALLRSERGD